MSGAAVGREEAVALARLGAAAAAGDPERLAAALAADAERLGADLVEEILLQTYLFAGFPRAIEAFTVWERWTTERGRRLVEPADPAAWRERGERLCRRVYDDRFEALQARLEALHPALAEWTLVEGYGKTLARPGADAGRRELAAVGALVALGARRQLASHLRGALAVGVAPDVLEAAARAADDGSGLVDRLLLELDRIP